MNQPNTTDSTERERSFQRPVEAEICRSLTTIHTACHLTATSDILCRQFEDTMRRELADVRPRRRIAHIKASCESFLREHDSLLRSRNPDDIYSVLTNPTDSSAQDRFAPTSHRPGSEDKVLILIERYAAGVPLWHPHDASYDAERTALLQEREILPEGE
jgi:hypothetical protein